MITPEYASLMARYNRWQNRSLYTAAEGIGEAARHHQRGAFFGSIHGTLAHLLWGDAMWMARFDGWATPTAAISDSAGFVASWQDLKVRRAGADDKIVAWADGLTQDALAGNLSWYSGAVGHEMIRPRALCVAHLFNHQTHHRGQVHAMLTAAGARPQDTDLVFMELNDA